MPKFHITIHNEDFTSSDDQECTSQEEALKQAIKSAISIASDQVASGKAFFGAVVTVAKAGKTLVRYVVSVGGSPLKD